MGIARLLRGRGLGDETDGQEGEHDRSDDAAHAFNVAWFARAGR
jgi:hypothetical protein